MERFARFLYHPCIPMAPDRRTVTGCREHIELSRRAAAEGAVLLKNNSNTLPFSVGQKTALIGESVYNYIKGGGGSGDVHCEYVRSIYEGLKIKETEGKIILSSVIGDINDADDRVKSAAENTDTAVLTFSRFSGEDRDRTADLSGGDYYLTSGEKALLEQVCSLFSNVIVVLNICGMTDLSEFEKYPSVKALLYSSLGGMEGGLAVADILCGDVNPSGKLTDTFAYSYNDYPSSAGFENSKDYVEYSDDVFVGYRYFETIPCAAEKVLYPFGFGLSYTSFALGDINIHSSDEIIIVSLNVKNTGSVSGKEVVQVYYSAPDRLIAKPSRQLAAFKKTKELLPGESQYLILDFPVSNMASFDDAGAIDDASYVLEKGLYSFFVGNSVRDCIKADYKYKLSENYVCKKLTHRCVAVNDFNRLDSKGNTEKVPQNKSTGKTVNKCKAAEKPENTLKLYDVKNENDLEAFAAQLNTDDMIELVSGAPNTGLTDTFGFGNLPQYGVPNVGTADGPAGVRIEHDCVKTTAWPCATLLASTWNTELVKEIGAAAGKELKENNFGVWLTPALNIHRNPLCGRNFEYYSEDPLISGKMAAAMVNGIQSNNVSACVKHFACNNKETNRFESNSIVSERALREIYLKGFEICIAESSPRMLMTSYNLLNGVHTSESYDLLTGILRNEWNYSGTVTTDWANTANHVKELLAGNNLRMPFGQKEKLKAAFEHSEISENDLKVCVLRILNTIIKFD